MTTRAEDASYFGRSGVSLASTISALGDSTEVGEAWLRGSRERRSQTWQQAEHVQPVSVSRRSRETPQEQQKRFILEP